MSLYFKLITKGANLSYSAQKDKDAWLTIQMLFTKTSSFIQLLNGFAYQDGDVKLSPIIDPTVLFSIARDIYESISMYQLIFILPKTEEQKNVAYALYRIAGLMERQNFVFDPDNRGATKLLEEELHEIIQLRRKIKHSEYYKALPKQEKLRLMGVVNSDRPSARFLYEDTGIKPIEWEKAYLLYGLEDKAFRSLYAYLSNHTHATYLSFSQYSEAFARINPQFKHLACMASQTLAFLLSVYIVDFCKIYESAQVVFCEQDEIHQWFIDKLNIDMRGLQYALSKK